MGSSPASSFVTILRGCKSHKSNGLRTVPTPTPGAIEEVNSHSLYQRGFLSGGVGGAHLSSFQPRQSQTSLQETTSLKEEISYFPCRLSPPCPTTFIEGKRGPCNHENLPRCYYLKRIEYVIILVSVISSRTMRNYLAIFPHP